MKVRSLALALLGVGLLATAATLGWLLVHDGESGRGHLADAQAGDAVQVKGDPEPFHPANLAAWATVRPLLGNHSYLLDAEPGVVALLTSTHAMPAGTVLAEGRVAFIGPHPTDPEALLVVIDVQDWRAPLLFD